MARIGPNYLLLDDPFSARRILEARSKYLRSPGFNALKVNPQLTNVVAEQDPLEHDRLRRQLAAGVILFLQILGVYVTPADVFAV